MDEYDFDPMTKAAFDFGGEDAETAWQSYKERFAMAPKDARIAELRMVDGWLISPQPLKSTAATWQKFRDLRQLHDALMKIGR